MGHPQVLFLDEPRRGLDLSAKRAMWNLLLRLAATENVTTFLSSHDAREIQSLCSELGDNLDEFEERLVALLTQHHEVL
jgi:ABC-type multidrug transport system ATPase subunit